MYADEALELFREGRQVCGTARQDDLADAETPRLVLVELQRRDELASERLHLAPNGVDSDRRLFLGQLVGGRSAVERHGALDRLDLGRSAVECTGERDVQRRAAPFDDACELADASVRDGERRAVVSDRDGDERRPVAIRRSTECEE